MADFYITTAIDYVNGSPHIGHAYEKILTDVIARFRRLMGDRVYFLTGTDEHGQKVQQTARKKGVPPLEFADGISAEFKAMLPRLEISNDDFIRTTEERHKKVVRALLQQLFDKGDIYKGEYHGFYSTRQEQFLQEKDRNPTPSGCLGRSSTAWSAKIKPSPWTHCRRRLRPPRPATPPSK